MYNPDHRISMPAQEMSDIMEAASLQIIRELPGLAEHVPAERLAWAALMRLTMLIEIRIGSVVGNPALTLEEILVNRMLMDLQDRTIKWEDLPAETQNKLKSLVDACGGKIEDYIGQD